MTDAPPSSGRAKVAPGDRVGKFRVERVIGHGGMGIVVEATNVQLDQRVAIKLLAPGRDTPEAITAVLNEARAVSRLRSDHVARVQDVDTDPVHGPYIVMELLDGTTLAEVIATPQRVAVHRAVEYIIDACEGLAEAHVRGIVHQDIKPANLFVAMGNDGRATVKILDFGIAKMRDTSVSGTSSGSIDLRMGGSGSALGTPFYLAPEQLRGDTGADHRADIWALGCVLFELLTRTKAFYALRFTELVVQILESNRAEVPAEVDVQATLLEVIDRCLSKDASKRYASTGELALALLPFARRRALSVTTRAVTRVRDGGLDPHLSMPSSMPPRPSDTNIDLVSSQSLRAPPVARITLAPAEPPPGSRRRPLVVLAVAMLALGALLVVVFALRGTHASSTEAASTPPASIVPLPPRAAVPAKVYTPEELPTEPESIPAASASAAQPAPAKPADPAPPPPAGSGFSVPRDPDSEIRMTR